MTDLDISVQIETAPGVFLELEDAAAGYECETGTARDRSVTYRQTTAGEVPWSEGSTTASSVRENIVETVSIWVSGTDPFDFDTKMTALTNALEQLSYRIVRRVGNSKQTWQCQPAQYTITTQQEYLVATIGLVTAQVPRAPTMILEEV